MGLPNAGKGFLANLSKIEKVLEGTVAQLLERPMPPRRIREADLGVRAAGLGGRTAVPDARRLGNADFLRPLTGGFAVERLKVTRRVPEALFVFVMSATLDAFDFDLGGSLCGAFLSSVLLICRGPWDERRVL